MCYRDLHVSPLSYIFLCVPSSFVGLLKLYCLPGRSHGTGIHCPFFILFLCRMCYTSTIIIIIRMSGAIVLRHQHHSYECSIRCVFLILFLCGMCYAIIIISFSFMHYKLYSNCLFQKSPNIYTWVLYATERNRGFYCGLHLPYSLIRIMCSLFVKSWTSYTHTCVQKCSSYYQLPNTRIIWKLLP